MNRKSITTVLLLMSLMLTQAMANGLILPQEKKALSKSNFPTTPFKAAKAAPNSGEILRPTEYGFENFGTAKDKESKKQVTSDDNYNKAEVIASVQRRLKARGHDIDKVNGKLDSQTKKALTDFQNTQGIVNNGKINQSTLDALDIVIIPDATSEGVYSE